MESREALISWRNILSEIQPGEKDRYEIDPDSHLSAYLFVAVESYRQHRDTEVFKSIMSTIFARDYVVTDHVETFLDQLREQDSSLMGLLEEAWETARLERQ